MKERSKKIVMAAVAALLTAVLLGIAVLNIFQGLTGLQMSVLYTEPESGFRLETPEETSDVSAVSLSVTQILREDFEEYGIMSTAESAQRITATVNPYNNAPNTKMQWVAAFEDPASAWASGKNVDDYIELSFGSDYSTSKVCTVSCKQPFGEPIGITGYCEEFRNVEAKVVAQYEMRITNFRLNFESPEDGSYNDEYGSLGDPVVCVWDGYTDVQLDVNAKGKGTPNGGMPYLMLTTSAHTHESETKVEYKLEGVDHTSETGQKDVAFTDTQYIAGFFSMGVAGSSTSSMSPIPNDLSKYDVANNGLIFSLPYLTDKLQFRACLASYNGSMFQGSSVAYLDLTTTAKLIIDCLGHLTSGARPTSASLFKLTVTVSNDYSGPIVKTTTFRATGYKDVYPVSVMTDKADGLHF